MSSYRLTSEMEQKISDIKAVLRSLIISESKYDVSISRLNALYREEEGEPIPYRKFGYPNLISFLSSLNDTLVIRPNREGQQCVYHILSEKSAHISAMVSKQKASSKSRSKKNKLFNSYRHKPQNAYNRYKVVCPRTQVNSSVVMRVLIDLKNSRQSSHQGLRKVDILSGVKKVIGEYLAYTIQDLNSHLNELSNVVKVENDYVYFIEDLIHFNSCGKPLHTVNNAYTCNSSVNSTKVIDNTYQSFNSIEHNKFNSQERSMTNGTVRKEIKSSETTSNKEFIKNNDTISEETKIDNSKYTKQTIDNNTTEQKIKDNESNEKEKILTNGTIDQEIDKNVSNPNIKKVSNEVINERTKFRLEKLIEKHPEGIWCSELPSLFKKEYNIELNYVEYGFDNINQFVAVLPDIFLVLEPPGTNRQIIVNAKKFDSNIENRNVQKTTLASLYNYDDYIESDLGSMPIKLSKEVSLAFVPDGFMTLNDIVDPILVSSFQPEDYIEVLVSEIFTPSFFWIRQRKNKKKLSKLMTDLDAFFRTKAEDIDEYKVPQLILQPGLNVACVYADMWHRAIIKKVKPDGFVTVFFYDYGTVKTYDPNYLHFLHKRFSYLPAQAIACSLHHVKPIGSTQWPTTSTNAFIKKVWDIPLIAFVTSKNEENNTMTINLTDTSDDNFDLHISDWMVENKFAEWGKMAEKIPIHRLCAFDEVELLKLKDLECMQSPKYYDKENHCVNDKIVNNQFEEVTSKESSMSLNQSSITTDLSCEILDVTTLVKENLDLVKQTNTIIQAILLNMPVNTIIDNNNLSIDSKSVDHQSDAKLFQEENINKNFSVDLNNVNSININISEVHSDAKFDVMSNEYLPSKHTSTTNSINRSSTFSLPLHQSNSSKRLELNVNFNNDDLQSKLCSNDHYDQQSTYSMFSNQTNSVVHSVKENSINQEKKEVNKKSETFNFQNDIKPRDKNNEPDNNYSTEIPNTSQTSNLSGFNPVNTSDSMFIRINLTEKCGNKIMHIFHLNNEGWLYANEFIDAFTNLKDLQIMIKLLQILGYNINFKHLTRDLEPQLFLQLDKSILKVPRERNRIKSDFVLTLMPIKDVIQVLVKLDFLSLEMVLEATPIMKKFKEKAEDLLFEKYNKKILYNAMNLIVQYKEFRRTLKKHSTR